MIGFGPVQRVMRSFLVVKLDITSYPFTQRSRVFEFVKEDAFVLERPEITLCAAVILGLSRILCKLILSNPPKGDLVFLT
ncbi:hypothetical protein XI25_07730 [Paenibacillus sp. DMB20]|nr:hypothetical protein XI25_07730 [Paenibacillus sp. DMB20]